MTRLRRLWDRWFSRPPLAATLTGEQERAFRFLVALMRRYDGNVEPRVRREFETFAREVERDRARQRRRP